MKDTNKLNPEIRFSGFTDDWEERKLGELALVLTGFPFKNEDFVDNGKYLVITNGNIQNESSTVDVSLGNRVDDLSDEIKERYYLNKNDILVTMDGTVGRTAKVVDDNLILAQRVARLVANKNTEFVYQWLNQGSFFNEMTKVSHGGTIKHISLNEISNYSATVPSNNIEQQKIGSFFKQLDDTIALHQRKLDKLKTLKKAMLEKMFPKNGESVPEIRFSGFTDDWEQRKLSECAGFRRGSFPQPYGNKEWYDGEGGMPFVQVADVADDMKLVDDTKQKISKMAQPMSVYADKGSVLVTLQGSIGRVAITQYGAFVDRTVLIFDKYNQDIDKTFWAYIIKEKFIDEARKAPGGTIKTITKVALSDFDLMLPNYDEQKKLGAFLVSIDNLITLHQRKLDKLKTLKKAMLEKMFI